jgi:hypothetical protein
MNTDAAPSIFDSYNARFLNPELIAESFVPSANFERLTRRTHSIVVGPRGSGKTSLLKMLQTPALENWKHARASEFREKIDYTGVFIAADIGWKQQLDEIGVSFLEEPLRKKLCLATFTTHVLHALTIAFINRKGNPISRDIQHRRIDVSAETEIQIVQTIAKAWKLSPATDSFLGLKHALSLRLNQIWEIAAEEELQDSAGRAARFNKHTFLNLHFLKAVSFAIEVFDDALSSPAARWALLFDELELAPEWILNELITSLRSINEKLLIKLSLSPFNNVLDLLQNSVAAMPGQDFTEIPLWFAHKEEGYSFSEELFTQILRSHGFAITLGEFLGESTFDASGSRPYAPESRQYKAFLHAHQTDPSFRRYVQLNSIRLHELDKMQDEERASVIRKIYPTILLRNFFRVPDIEKFGKSAARQRVRSVKRPIIYGGKNALLAMTEGNPRWLIGIATNLIRRDRPHVRKAEQVAEIEKSITRFRSLLKTVSASPPGSKERPRELLQLIDVIGNFFYQSAILDSFSAEPYGSFIVDSHIPPNLVNSIGIALNAGALVYVPDTPDEIFVKTVRGKRFRLTYLLSPFYHTPIRLGAPISLFKMLSRSGPTTQQGWLNL